MEPNKEIQIFEGIERADADMFWLKIGIIKFHADSKGMNIFFNQLPSMKNLSARSAHKFK